MSEAGTNPESSTPEITSHEDFVADMLSRPAKNADAEHAEEPGNQTDASAEESSQDKTTPEPKADEKAGTKPVGQNSEEQTKLELPKQQSAEYPKDVMAHYAKKFGSSLEDAEKNPALRSAIKTNIDNDIYIQQLKAQADAPKPQTEVKPKEEPETPKAEAAKPAATPDEYVKALEAELEQINSPEMVKRASVDIWKAFAGADINDPEVAKQLKDRGIDLDAPVKVLSTYALNIAKAVASQQSQNDSAQFYQRVEQTFPGFTDMYQNVFKSNAWDGVRDSNEAYKGLPDYGTVEFNNGVNKVVEQNPWLDRLEIKGATPQEVIRTQYEIAARIMSGQAVKPVDVTQAIQAGKQLEKEAQQRAANGRLDAGKTRGTASTSKGSDSDIVSAWQTRHASL